MSIPSLLHPAARLGATVRGRRAVENSLHGVMDMIFRDDEHGVNGARGTAPRLRR